MRLQHLTFSLMLILPLLAVPASGAPPFCGDLTCNGGETCDGDDFCRSTSCPTGTVPVCDASCGGYTCESTGGSYCGDGVLDAGEECDGNDFGGQTCSSFGFSSGSLSCDGSCTIDTSGCSNEIAEGSVELLPTVRTDDVSETNISSVEQRLLDLIDFETVSIKAAIDGLSRQNVVDALLAAHNRGVTVQVVADCEIVVVGADAEYQQLISAGIPVVDDNNTFDGPSVDPGCTSTQTSGFCHNKFLVFEAQQTIWTGSTNLTDFGFNSSQNMVVIISDNAGAVDFYDAEFGEMFGNGVSLRDGGTGRFGQQKTLDPGIGSFTMADGTVVEVAFSPYESISTFDSDTELQMNATIDSAASELHWATFYLTYDDLRTKIDDNGATLKRGMVDPRTTDDYDDTQLLISNGEDVLVTNILGTHHWKMAIADPDDADGQVIVGSHNFSNSSFNYNNENNVRILSPTLAQEARTAFDTMWNDPQNAGLVGCIHPGESYNENSLSLHRCNDAYDNDFDGLTDGADGDCAAPFVCGACGAPGDSCTSGADCCSGSCGHGPPSERTCT